MTFARYLGPGDGAVSGALNLGDGINYAPVLGALDLGAPNTTTNRRTITQALDIYATDTIPLWRQIAAIEDQLRAARLAAKPNSGLAPIVFSLKLNSTDYTYYDVLDGSISPPAQALATSVADTIQGATLTLSCAAYGRGPRLVATNLLLNSANPSAASYTATNLTATANALIGPNGDAVGSTLLETTDDDVHTLSQSVTKAASAINYAVGFYGKPAGRDIIDLTLTDSTGDNGASMTVNLATGVILTAAATFGTGFTLLDSGIVAKPHDYYRPWIAATSNTDTAIEAVIALRKDAATDSYTGDEAKGIAAWGLTLQPNATTIGPYLETGDSLTLVNGTDQGPYLYDLPGDTAGLVRLTFSDVSTNGVVIQEAYIGATPVDWSGDYAGIQTITPADGASFADTDSITGTVAQGFAGQTTTRIGTITKPADAPMTDGRMLALARVRDGSSGMGAPTGLSATKGAIRSGIQQFSTKGTGSSVTVTFDKTAVSGNTLRATVGLQDYNTTITTPSGWTAVTGTLNDVTLIGRIEEFYKVSDGTEESVTFAFSSSTVYGVAGEEVAGIKASSPNDVSATQPLGSPNDVTGTTSATSQANEYAVGAILFRTAISDGDNRTPQNGYTTFQDIGLGTSPVSELVVMHKTLTATGTQSTGIIVGVPRTSVAYITTYKGLTTAAPSMPAGNYQIVIAGVDADGNVGTVSQPYTIALTSTDAIALTWSAPTTGPDVDHYRVYWLRLGTWSYFDTADATTQYILTTETSPDGTDTPVFGNSAFGQYRLPYGLASGTVMHDPLWRSTLRANSTYELLNMGVMTGTPQPNRWGNAALGWQLGVDIIHATSSPPMTFDSTWLLKANGPIIHLLYLGNDGTPGGLASNRDWQYDLRPDLGASCVLYETGSSTEAGSFVCDGRLQIGPGAVQVTIAVVAADGECDVTDAAFQVGLEVVPLYEYLAS